ncbi:expressed protein [Chlorella variabilis]|uniref:Expressed protein n=1 Tax=Chlorella variabilis TaxID=554065 RepID=E1Z3N7_CHLVA|nr:expressed protein [Chlorella variabilis]EFN59561.1 expressed protein [Chlorella variabilis]|eukprot:XP_005851663.1 expressed protein [Chlorella variabilis]
MTPLQLALSNLTDVGDSDDDLLDNEFQSLDAARCLLAAGPALPILSSLAAAGPAALPLYADFVIARLPLSGQDWALVPAPCPGLCGVLPAALAHSPEQARQLVRHLPPPYVQRLRTAALALHRAQKELGTSLPPPIVGLILAAGCAE